MAFALTVHYDNQTRLSSPQLRVWYAGSTVREPVAPSGADDFGPVYRLSAQRPEFGFNFGEGPDRQAGDGHERLYRPVTRQNGALDPSEVWCRANRAFVYRVRPADPEPEPADAYVRRLAADPGFPPGLELPATGGLSGLGANLLNDGRVLFGLYHPTAARVYLTGSFNNWQCPGAPSPTLGVRRAAAVPRLVRRRQHLADRDRAGPGGRGRRVQVLCPGRHRPG